MKHQATRLALGAFVLCFLLFPFIVLFFSVSGSGSRVAFPSETWGVLLFTVAQASASALVSLALGLIGGLGLIWAGRFSPGWARWTEMKVLLPNVAPVLLMILAALKAFPGLRGFFGIVAVHALLNSGLVAVSFVRLVKDKISGMADLALVEGASGPRFFFRGALPYLRGDLLLLGLFVFAVCFSSFSVPLMLGGSQGTTLEVLTYQKIRIDGDWSAALGISSLQMASLLVLSWSLRRDGGTGLVARPGDTPLLAWRWGLIAALFPPALLVWGLVDGFANGLRQLLELDAFWREFPVLLAGSVLVATGTGLLSAVFLLAIAYIDPRGAFRKFLLGYIAPSTALAGFALLIAWRATGLASQLKIVIGLVLITVPSFYRLQWDNALRALRGQRTVASTMGANDGLIFTRVILPQILRPCLFIAGVASLWAWGDFALSRVVAERNLTLAMAVQSLMESYRLDAATVLVWIVCLGGSLSFAIFTGVGRVLGAKSQA